MIGLINYIFESAIILLLFLLIYVLIFRKAKWLPFNRFYLLFVLALSMILPLTDFTISSPVSMDFRLGDETTTFNMNNLDIKMNDDNAIVTHFKYFWIIYILVSISLSLILVYNLYQIWKLAHAEAKEKKHDQEAGVAFSFFHYVFIHPLMLQDPNYHLIIEHELAHSRQLHSLDILLIEFLKILFWINPLLWIFKMLIRENHEFLADQCVVTKYPDRLNVYKHQILSIQLSPFIPVLINNFNYSHYKHRFIMMTKDTLSGFSKGLYILYFMFSVIIVAACDTFMNGNVKEHTVDITTLDDLPVYRESFKDIYVHFQQNITYPGEARANNVQGRYFVAFTVKISGEIADINISTEDNGKYTKLEEIVVVGYGMSAQTNNATIGEQAILKSITDTMESYKNMMAGKKDGQPVNTRMVLPVQFKLG